MPFHNAFFFPCDWDDSVVRDGETVLKHRVHPPRPFFPGRIGKSLLFSSPTRSKAFQETTNGFPWAMGAVNWLVTSNAKVLVWYQEHSCLVLGGVVRDAWRLPRTVYWSRPLKPRVG